MKNYSALLAFFLSTCAIAQTFSTPQFVRFGSKTISSGDTVRKLLDCAGEPEEKVDMINGFGVKRGEKWTYKTGSRSWTIVYVSYGTVSSVETMIE